MIKWEYMNDCTHPLDRDKDKLANYGLEGWEAYTVFIYEGDCGDTYHYFFKRKIKTKRVKNES